MNYLQMSLSSHLIHKLDAKRSLSLLIVRLGWVYSFSSVDWFNLGCTLDRNVKCLNDIKTFLETEIQGHLQLDDTQCLFTDVLT